MTATQPLKKTRMPIKPLSRHPKSRITKPMARQSKSKGSRASRSIQAVKMTRSRTEQKRTTFPFLSLPGEIRMMIYDHALDFRGLQAVIKDVSGYQGKSKKRRYVNSQHHALLQLNRQVHEEASHVLWNKTLVIEAGNNGMQLVVLEDLVPRAVLLKLKHVVIKYCAGTGDQHIKSWSDFHTITMYCATIWGSHHSLRTLHVDFCSPEIQEHITSCWKTEGCTYWAMAHKVLLSLKRVRGVRESVRLDGAFRCFESTKRIEALMMNLQPFRFSKLSVSVRNAIYSYSVDWNDALRPRAKSKLEPEDANPTELRSTPNILLLSKTINKEATKVLQKRPLVFNNAFAPLGQLYTSEKTCTISQFISDATLKRVKNVIIEIDLGDGKGCTLWKDLIAALVNLWINGNGNGNGNGLQNLRLHVIHSTSQGAKNKHHKLAALQILEPLRQLHGVVKKVSLAGGIFGTREKSFFVADVV